MSLDYELLQEYKEALADRYTAAELVELMGLDVWDILDCEDLEEKIIQLRSR